MCVCVCERERERERERASVTDLPTEYVFAHAYVYDCRVVVLLHRFVSENVSRRTTSSGIGQ